MVVWIPVITHLKWSLTVLRWVRTSSSNVTFAYMHVNLWQNKPENTVQLRTPPSSHWRPNVRPCVHGNSSGGYRMTRNLADKTTVDTLGDYMLHCTISLFRFAYNHLNEFVRYEWLQLCLSECLSELIKHRKGWCACKRRWTLPAGDANCRRTLLQPRVMMKDCFPTRLHSVSLDTEHLKTHVSSSVEKSNYTDINIHVW